MKKTIKFKMIFSFLILTFLLNGIGYSNVLDKLRHPHYTWGDKLKRGAVNVISSPVEVARQIQMTSSEQSLLAGWTLGLISGVGQGFLRFGAGVIDVFTFPFDFPDSNKGPLIEPEYVWQKPGPKYS